MKNKIVSTLSKFFCLLIALVTLTVSASAQAPASWGKGIIQDGHPVVELGDPAVRDAWTPSISLLEYKREMAFVFFVQVLREQAFGNDIGYGKLYVTATSVTYVPDVTSGIPTFSTPTATYQQYDSSNSWIPTPIGKIVINDSYVGGILNSWGKFRELDPSKDDYKNYVRNAKSAGAQASSELTSWLELATSNFDAAVQKFKEMTQDVSTPLTSEQDATVKVNEQAGDAAEQAGKLFDALQHYQAALQALPTQWAPADVEQPLRERIVKLVQRMNPPPAIPEEAERHEAYAMAALDQAKTGDYSSSIQEFHQTLQLAPWWGAAYFNYALVLEKAGRYAAASRNLKLYLLASPNAQDAQTVQMKIYTLEYKANHP